MDKLEECNSQEEIRNIAKEFRNKNEKVYQNIYKNLFQKIDQYNSVFTFTNSKTVFKILSLWKKDNENITVYMTESRPANEGKILAEKLLKKKIRIFYSADADMKRQIKESDFVLFGADKIIKNKCVINKTGSSAAAIIAAYFNKPVYAVASKNKISDKAEKEIESKNPAEIWKRTNKKLRVINKYFEEVELNLITEIITD